MISPVLRRQRRLLLIAAVLAALTAPLIGAPPAHADPTPAVFQNGHTKFTESWVYNNGYGHYGFKCTGTYTVLSYKHTLSDPDYPDFHGSAKVTVHVELTDDACAEGPDHTQSYLSLGFMDAGGNSWGGGSSLCWIPTSGGVCSFSGGALNRAWTYLLIRSSATGNNYGARWNVPTQPPEYRAPVADWPGINTGGVNPALDAQPCAVADPVSCATGELFETLTDLTLPGRSPFTLARTYSSQRDAWTTGELFGQRWFSPLDMGLTWSPDLSTAMMRQETGATVQFLDPDGDGTYAPAARGGATLTTTRDTAGTPTGYTFTRNHGDTTILLDADGRLDQVADRNGNGYTVTWPAAGSGDPLTVTTTDGRTVTLTLNGTGRVTAATGPAGRTVSYAYTGGELTAVTDAHGQTWTYDYDGAGNLLTQTDPLGHASTNTYDADRRVLTQTDPRGKTSTSTAPPGTAPSPPR